MIITIYYRKSSSKPQGAYFTENILGWGLIRRVGAYSVATKNGHKYLLLSGRYLSPSKLCWKKKKVCQELKLNVFTKLQHLLKLPQSSPTD